MLRTAAESHANKSVSDLGLSDNARAMLISQKMQDAYSMISVTMQASFVRQIRRSAANIRSAFTARAGLTRIDAITQNRTNANRAHIITNSPPRSPSVSPPVGVTLLSWLLRLSGQDNPSIGPDRSILNPQSSTVGGLE